MKNSYKFIALTWTILLSAALISSCGDTNTGHKDNKEKAEEKNEAKFNDHSAEKDADFVLNAYSGGLCEIEKSKLAESKASDKKIKALAADMIKAHSAMNEKLKALAVQKQISLPQGLSDDQKKDLDEATSAASGRDWDKKFIEKQVDKHTKMVKLFEDASNDASDINIKNFFAAELPAVRQHLDRAMSIKDSYQ